MKKVLLMSLLGLVAASAAVYGTMQMPTSNTRHAGAKAKEYVEYFKNGRYNMFVNSLVFGDDVTASQARAERAKYERIFREKVGPIMQAKGGLRDVIIVSEDVSNDGREASVTLRNLYNNGQSEEFDYDLVWVDGNWRINMPNNRDVWTMKNADGNDVSFTVKDYDDKKVFKQEVDGDKQFIKVKDKGDDVVVKTLNDGDRKTRRMEKRELRREMRRRR